MTDTWYGWRTGCVRSHVTEYSNWQSRTRERCRWRSFASSRHKNNRYRHVKCKGESRQMYFPAGSFVFNRNNAKEILVCEVRNGSSEIFTDLFILPIQDLAYSLHVSLESQIVVIPSLFRRIQKIIQDPSRARHSKWSRQKIIGLRSNYHFNS